MTTTTDQPSQDARAIQDVDQMLDDLFTYHVPTESDIQAYKELRTVARQMAGCIATFCPMSADRTAAMRLLQDCVMTANRSIALKGRSYR